MNLTQRFRALDDNLKLDPKQRARAEFVHNQLCDILIESGIAKRTRVQGSFARKTMLPPLHDIDKIIELVDDLRDVLITPGGPAKAMSMIQDVLRPKLPGASFELKKHALAITLPDEGFDFDAVPAFNPEDGTGWIVIADTEDDDWEPSNTYQLIDTIARRNQDCGGNFIHQVRMIKQVIKKAGVDELLPGLHLETYAYNSIESATADPEAVAAILRTGATMLGTRYAEPTGVDFISERLDPSDVVVAKKSLGRLADRADEALRLAVAGDEDGAAWVWAELFGDVFPGPTSQAAEKAFLTGLSTPTAGTTASRPRTTSTRAWRP